MVTPRLDHGRNLQIAIDLAFQGLNVPPLQEMLNSLNEEPAAYLVEF